MADRNFVLLSTQGKPYIMMGPKRYAVVLRRRWKKEWSAHVDSVHNSMGQARVAASDLIANSGYPRRLVKVYPVVDLSTRSPWIKFV